MDRAVQMRKLRGRLRELLPGPLRERYHRYALRRDFGIDQDKGTRKPARLERHRAAGLNLIGYFDSPSGVGQSARALALAAEAAGVRVERIEASDAASRRPPRAPYDVNLFHVNADGAASVVEELGPRLHAGRANAAYWYWESEVFPARWKDRFAYFDEIWVATRFCQRAVARASPIEVAVVPPAVTPPTPPAQARPRAGLPESAFLFLTLFDALSVPERKNPLGTIRAFVRAFPNSSDVSLLVQASHAEEVPGLPEAMREAARGASVLIRDAVLPRSDVDALFAACDACVSLHRAEGFGFPIAETMSLGKPVVATDYSGSTDYLDESTGFPVRWRRTTLPETARDYEAGTSWAEPDEDHAVEMLRRVVQDRDEAARRGEAGRRRIAELYAPEVAGRQLASRLESLRARLGKTP